MCRNVFGFSALKKRKGKKREVGKEAFIFKTDVVANKKYYCFPLNVKCYKHVLSTHNLTHNLNSYSL